MKGWSYHLEVKCSATKARHIIFTRFEFLLLSLSLFFLSLFGFENRRIEEKEKKTERKNVEWLSFQTFFYFSLRSSISKWTVESAPHYLYTLWISSALSFSLLSLFFFGFQNRKIEERKREQAWKDAVGLSFDHVSIPFFIFLFVHPSRSERSITKARHTIFTRFEFLLLSLSLFFLSFSFFQSWESNFSLRSSISKFSIESAPFLNSPNFLSSLFFLSLFLFSDLRIEKSRKKREQARKDEFLLLFLSLFFLSFSFFRIWESNFSLRSISKFTIESASSLNSPNFFSSSLFLFPNLKIEKSRTGAEGWISSPLSSLFSDLRIEKSRKKQRTGAKGWISSPLSFSFRI